jgi:phosphoenolpyruvate phosphomutase / 2-hydroxyethylphosphonate cytidylyltransferase
MTEINKLVYVPMAVDFIHVGHLNIIKVAASLGSVMVGLFTDKAIASYKRLPFMPYEQRKIIVENVKGVDRVVCQDTPDYEFNLRKYKPNFMVHGTDWREGPLKDLRAKAIEILAEWGGEMIEPDYTQGISSTELHVHLKAIGTTPQLRLAKLRRLLSVKNIVRVMEAHSGLSALIVDKTEIKEPGKPADSFDAVWLSSLTTSATQGKPDIELTDLSSRLKTVNDIFEVTVKPMIFDGDTGGIPEHFIYTVRTLERLGVSAVIIEDKKGLKVNSLFGPDPRQEQDSVKNFCRKISLGKKAQVATDFMIIARIESLILEKGMDDALLRAKAYIDSGADGIVIHSRAETPDDILAFCDRYENFKYKVPLFVIPTTFSQIYESELAKAGVNAVIYANHFLRAAYPAMVKTAESILRNRRAFEASMDFCMPISDVLKVLPNRC